MRISLPVLLLRALATLTSSCPEKAQEGFTSDELAEQVSKLLGKPWVVGAKTAEEINRKVREPWNTLTEKIWPNKLLGLKDRAEEKGWGFRAKLDRIEGGGTGSEDTLTTAELKAARVTRVAAACQPFDKPELRDEIESARREREQIIDHINLDAVTFAGFSEQAEAAAQKTIQSFADYIAQHKDEIAALGFFYQQP